jgi:hypothetical protein
MLWIGNKEVSQLWVGSKSVQALYLGAKLIWEAVNSCFENGFWVKDKAWNSTDSWRIN